MRCLCPWCCNVVTPCLLEESTCLLLSTVMCLSLHMCILISCSVVCVDGLGYVYVYEIYVVLDQCDKPPSLFVLSVCAYGGVVGYFWCFGFLCEFVSCIVIMSCWVLCTRSFSISFLMPFILI